MLFGTFYNYIFTKLDKWWLKDTDSIELPILGKMSIHLILNHQGFMAPYRFHANPVTSLVD